MSTSKRRKVSASGPPVPAVKRKWDELYDQCVTKKGIGGEFSMAELINLDVTGDHDELAKLCNELLNCYLFVLYSRRSTLLYRTRSKEEALKLSKLTSETSIVYSHIAGTGRSGIWKKTLASKTNLHENTVTKSIKELIGKNLIKEFKSSKNPSKRMYVLFHLEPSEDSTGGNFYKDGDLDEGLVNTLGDLIVRWIEEKSWIEQKTGTAEKGKVGRRKKPDKDALDPQATSKHAEPAPRFKTPRGINGYPLIPHPPSFSAYPTPQDAHRTIVEMELVKDMTLDLDDVAQLMQQLVYLDRLEEMPQGGYRSVRRITGSKAQLDQMSVLDDAGDGLGPGNALAEVPCGSCPVESECRVGGIVSPESCVYLDKWLEF